MIALSQVAVVQTLTNLLKLANLRPLLQSLTGAITPGAEAVVYLHDGNKCLNAVVKSACT